MGVFEKMLSGACRQAFLDRLEGKFNTNQAELSGMREYIPGRACTEDILRLQNGDFFFFDAPQQFYVRKSHSDKRRRVYSFYGRDKYLLKFMTFILLDFDDIHVPSLCSFRKDNRTRMFFKSVRRFDAGRRCYVIKTDIHDYGGSVDQDILLRIPVQ